MIAIGNGESCPFCTTKQLEAQQSDEKKEYNDVFIMEEGKDFIKHASTIHPKEFEKALFGGKDIGL